MEPLSGFIEYTAGERPFVIYLPKAVTEPVPTILFLHGAGECGTDGLKQVSVGLPPAIMTERARWPFAVVIPQKDEVRKLWADDVAYLDEVLEIAEGVFPSDPHRRYLTGLSQGGRGTFDLVKRLRWSFAAAAPVCGWADLEQVARDYQSVPAWVFHGDQDGAVPVQASRDAVAAIQAAGGDVTYTEYPGVDHNSWDKAYRESDLPSWFLTHSL